MSPQIEATHLELVADIDANTLIYLIDQLSMEDKFNLICIIDEDLVQDWSFTERLFEHFREAMEEFRREGRVENGIRRIRP